MLKIYIRDEHNLCKKVCSFISAIIFDKKFKLDSQATFSHRLCPLPKIIYICGKFEFLRQGILLNCKNSFNSKIYLESNKLLYNKDKLRTNTLHRSLLVDLNDSDAIHVNQIGLEMQRAVKK